MKSKNLYRVGGISAFTVLLIILLYRFELVENYFNGFLNLILYNFRHTFLVFVAWALYRLYASKDRRLSLFSLISSLLGVAVFLIFTWATQFDFPDVIFTISIILVSRLPALLFGILGYRYPEIGISRPLAVTSILFGCVYIIFYFMWAVFPDLSFGFFDSLPRTLEFIWLTWMGVVLLFGKLDESSDKINI